MKNSIFQKWFIAFKTLPIVAFVVALKIGAHTFGWEVLSLNPLFTGLIAASVFLIGFLVSGVLSDYKESEKLPGELATSVEALFHEISLIYKSKKAAVAKDCLTYTAALLPALKDWFYRKEPTAKFMERLSDLGDFFLALEPLTQVSYIVRMKENQNAIRRSVIRIETIRNTSFVSSGYAIAQVIILLVSVGLILVKADPFYETLFFGALVVFLLLYMLVLIQNLDDPFDYSGGFGSLDEISLDPLEDAEKRLNEMLQQWGREEWRLTLANGDHAPDAIRRVAGANLRERRNGDPSKTPARAR